MLIALALLPSIASAAQVVSVVSGHVYDSGVNPLQGICLDSYPAATYPLPGVGPFDHQVTAADGGFAITVPVGSSVIRTWDCAHTPPMLADQFGTVGTTGGDVPAVEIHLVPGGSASGTVRDQLGNPVPNACVVVSPEGFTGQALAIAATDSAGHYTTGGVPTTPSLVSSVDVKCDVSGGPLVPLASSGAYSVSAGQDSPGHDIVLQTGGTGVPTGIGVDAPACIVPRLVGLSLSKAKTALVKAHCSVGRITKRAVAKKIREGRVKKGTVLAQTRKVGTTAPARSKVGLVVAK
ncbi:MAG: PASTA domain-containing protein [Thermoleophilaceae bacterium]